MFCFFIIYIGYIFDINLEIYNIICKVIILLLLFRFIFVYSIRFVYFFWIEVFGIYMRNYIFFYGVINRIVIYKEKMIM